MQKLHFNLSSILDNQGCQMDINCDNDYELSQEVFSRCEKFVQLIDGYGWEVALVKFKNGGYGFYESSDYNPTSDEMKPVIYEGEKAYLAKTSNLDFYISNDLEELIEKIRSNKFYITEKHIQQLRNA